jgi:hypothetical protein
MSKHANVTCLMSFIVALCLHDLAPAASLLRFQPKAGEKRTVRITMREATVHNSGGRQSLRGVQSENVTLGLEPVQVGADGRVVLRATLEAIQARVEANGRSQGQYDSTKPAQGMETPVTRQYAGFAGNSFTVGISSQGRIMDADMNDLFQVVAVNRISGEDMAAQRLFRNNPRERIEAEDRRYGSRANRTLAMKKVLEQDTTFGKDYILGLVRNAMASLPGTAVESGATWDGDVVAQVGRPMPIPATCTLKAQDGGICTIDVTGHRAPGGEPIVFQDNGAAGQEKISQKLSGSYQATVKVDQATGWLLHRAAKTSLKGQMESTRLGRQSATETTDVAIENTTTVEPVQSQ